MFYNNPQKLSRTNLKIRQFERLESREMFAADLMPSSPIEIAPPLESNSVWAAEPLPQENLSHVGSAFSVPGLSSKPDAPVTVYLDFDGHFEPVWGAWSNISTPRFDLDGDRASLTTTERDAIGTIWAIVAEDFAPFNINVTTVEPASFADGVAVRVSIGGDGSWYGDAGGVAYLDSFTDSRFVNTAYVFSDIAHGNLGYLGDASSHEVGHTLGLHHQSRFDSAGNKVEEYHTGNGVWAPIMGYGPAGLRSSWSYGFDSEGGIQSDIAEITKPGNGITYRNDDHGNLSSNASPLSFSQSIATAIGIIEQTSDEDRFAIQSSGGNFVFSVSTPPWGNLDLVMTLRDANENIIATSDLEYSFEGLIVEELAQGNYTLSVSSKGQYGSLGQYQVDARVVGSNVTVVSTTQDVHSPNQSVVQVFGTAADDLIEVASIGTEEFLLTAQGEGLLVFNHSNVSRIDIDGNSGNDRLIVDKSWTSPTYLQGGDGDDYIVGGGGNDILRGSLGGDTIIGRSGNDVLYGGQGNDLLIGRRGADILYGGSGNDRLRGQKGADQLYGQDGDDILWGGPGKDLLSGGEGNDSYQDFNSLEDLPIIAKASELNEVFSATSASNTERTLETTLASSGRDLSQSHTVGSVEPEERRVTDAKMAAIDSAFDMLGDASLSSPWIWIRG